MSTANERLRKFATVWDKLKHHPDVQGLEMGHPERECALTTTDLHTVLDECESLRHHLRVLLHAYRTGNSISPFREAEMREVAGLPK